MSIPEKVPESFRRGDTVQWTLKPRKDGQTFDPAVWTLTYSFVSPISSFSTVATDNGDGRFLVRIEAADSAIFAPDRYSFQGVVTDATDAFTVDIGWTTVLPDFASKTTFDARVWTQRTLEAIEAVLEGKATSDQASMSLSGRSLARFTWEELLDARARLLRELASQEQALAIAENRYHSGVIRTRL